MKIRWRIALHVGFWLWLWTNSILGMYAKGKFPRLTHSVSADILIELTYNLMAACAFYLSVFWVMQVVLKAKKYLWAVCYLLVSLLVVTFFRYLIEMYFFKPYLGFDNYMGNTISMQWFVNNSFFFYLDYVIYGVLYALLENWYFEDRRRQALEKEKISAELAFLRSQINPHFLFNTINDIYVLAYQKSDKAPEALLKLSDLLRYILHDSMNDKVLLSKELGYVKSLIDLQKLGAKGYLFLDYSEIGEVGNHEIAPLLLVSFVENAFKHGIVTDEANPLKIQIKVANNELDFLVINKKNKQCKDKTGGIGLSNVKRRLDLLYAHHQSLVITETEDFFTAQLHINLH